MYSKLGSNTWNCLASYKGQTKRLLPVIYIDYIIQINQSIDEVASMQQNLSLCLSYRETNLEQVFHMSNTCKSYLPYWNQINIYNRTRTEQWWLPFILIVSGRGAETRKSFNQIEKVVLVVVHNDYVVATGARHLLFLWWMARFSFPSHSKLSASFSNKWHHIGIQTCTKMKW